MSVADGYGYGVPRTVRPQGVCRHCAKPIAQNRQGIWGARKRDDPHPWYCDQKPGDHRHEPT